MYFWAKGSVYVIPEPYHSFLSSHYSLQYAIKLSVQTQGEIMKEPNRLKNNLDYFFFFFLIFEVFQLIHYTAIQILVWKQMNGPLQGQI